MDENTCMVEVARFFMSFTQRESCGKCVPCREGTKRMLEILERIVDGKGKMSDLDDTGRACNHGPEHGSLRTRKERASSGYQHSETLPG